MAAFLWSQSGHNRVHWVALKKICRPLSNMGLGVLSLGDMTYSLHGELSMEDSCTKYALDPDVTVELWEI